jgi:iron complex transport system substrate-binding protein
MKICSLLPSGTEILFALGLGEQIVGVSDLCVYPPEARSKHVVSRSKIDAEVLTSDQVEELVQRLLSTGESPYELDNDWLRDNSPDVVLTQDLCFFCEVDAGQVHEAVEGMVDPPKVLVLQPKTVSQVFESIVQIGDACGAAAQAKVLVKGLNERVEAVTRLLEGTEHSPRVFSLEGINPIVIGGHWIPDLLRLAGGRQEMFPPGSPAVRAKWEEICEWAPEKLFIDLCSSDLARNQREIPWLANQPGWEDIPAVRTGEVYLLDHVYFSMPGPRIIDGLEILAQLTHPQLFSENIMPNTVLKLDADAARVCPPGGIGVCFRPFPA